MESKRVVILYYYTDAAKTVSSSAARCNQLRRLGRDDSLSKVAKAFFKHAKLAQPSVHIAIQLKHVAESHLLPCHGRSS